MTKLQNCNSVFCLHPSSRSSINLYTCAVCLVYCIEKKIPFTLGCTSRNIQGVPKKCTSDFSSHHWHKYFTHMENKDRYGILIISAFHAIFCFYSTPFQFFAIIRQSMSPPIFIHFILHLFKMSTITCNAFVASGFVI